MGQVIAMIKGEGFFADVGTLESEWNDAAAFGCESRPRGGRGGALEGGGGPGREGQGEWGEGAGPVVGGSV